MFFPYKNYWKQYINYNAGPSSGVDVIVYTTTQKTELSWEHFFCQTGGGIGAPNIELQFPSSINIGAGVTTGFHHLVQYGPSLTRWTGYTVTVPSGTQVRVILYPGNILQGYIHYKTFTDTP